MRRHLALILAVCLGVSACGDAANDTASSTTTGAAIAAPPSTTPPTTPPATVPQRIVSLSSSLTEMLYGVGAGGQVIAVDRYSNFPDGTPLTDLSGFSPNVEAIAELQPDLVVLANDRDGVVAALDSVGIPTLLLESADDIEGTFAQLDVIGAATGHEAEAGDLVAALGAALAEQVARVPEREAPLRAYIELSDDGYSATSASFLGSVLATAGLTSIADDAGDPSGAFPQLSAEYVLEQDPDVILLAHSGGTNPTPAELAARPGWSELAAVQGGAVVELDPDIASRWGPRIIELLTAVIDATVSMT